jgi:hypothetical protein
MSDKPAMTVDQAIEALIEIAASCPAGGELPLRIFEEGLVCDVHAIALASDHGVGIAADILSDDLAEVAGEFLDQVGPDTDLGPIPPAE